MANIIIKSDERREHEKYVLQGFHKKGDTVTSMDREATEIIAARSIEAYQLLSKMEERKK